MTMKISHARFRKDRLSLYCKNICIKCYLKFCYIFKKRIFGNVKYYKFEKWNVNLDNVFWVIGFLPCLTDTYLALDAATKLACGNESSSEKSSSLVTVGDLVFKTDLEPMGAR